MNIETNKRAELTKVPPDLAPVLPFADPKPDTSYPARKYSTGCMDEPFSWKHPWAGYSAPPATFKPSAWYFRDALRRATSIDAAIEVGLRAIHELEVMKDFIRETGCIPPLKVRDGE